MKISIDSKEPLEDVLRVVGAAYGVTLTTESGSTDSTESRPEASTTAKAAPRKRRGGSRTSRSTRGSSNGGRRPAAARKRTSTADVRAWARQQGHQISDRGPIAASVIDAYKAAQQS